MARRVLALRTLGLAAATALGLVAFRDDLAEKRVRTVVPGRLVRGAWQRPGPLLRLIEREKIRTIVTLTAINRDDPKYVEQERVVRQTGVDWKIIPMRGSRATPEQMAEAADLLADPKRQPVFFHCVAGHHRTSLAQAAYRIRHEGWSARAAWAEVAALPWARPDARPDQGDRRLIETFAARQRPNPEDRSRKDADHARSAVETMGRPDRRGALAAAGRVHRLEPRDR